MSTYVAAQFAYDSYDVAAIAKSDKMPIYFFDSCADECLRDDIGIECDSFQDATSKGLRGLADLAKDVLCSMKSSKLSILIRNHAGDEVLELVLSLDANRAQQLQSEDVGVSETSH